MLDCLFRRNTHFDLAPSMIGVACISLSDFTILSTDVWAKGLTDGSGVDVVIDALGPGAPQSTMLEALNALRRGRAGLPVPE